MPTLAQHCCIVPRARAALNVSFMACVQRRQREPGSERAAQPAAEAASALRSPGLDADPARSESMNGSLDRKSPEEVGQRTAQPPTC